jgi:SAM-dependent methyltransferase
MLAAMRLRKRQHASREEEPEIWDERRARGYVGPRQHFDLITAMSFNLLTTLGLREHHRLLDIGCGSLRVGRVLVPYLGRANYVGIEPNASALEVGVRVHLSEGMRELKQPILIASADPEDVPAEPPLDFAFAQSIFSHTGPDLMSGWLDGVSARLAGDGVLVASFCRGADSAPDGWERLYVTYSDRWIGELARAAGLEYVPVEWAHPGQSWALFRKPGFEVGWIEQDGLSWNAYLPRALRAMADDGRES